MDTKNSVAVEVIDLGHYWSVVRRQFNKIIALSSVATLISILVVLSLTPKYSATSTLLIEASENKVLSIEEVYGLSGNGSEYFLTQFEILKSRDIALRVVEKLNLVNSVEFNPFHANNQTPFSIKASILAMINGDPEPPTEKQILASTVDNFWSVVSIAPVRKTQLVKISVESEDASFAPIAANAVADAYIESQLEAKVGLTQQAADWLGARLGGLKEKLDISEHKLQEFREKNNLIDVEGVSTLVTKELDQVAGRLVSVRIELLDFKTRYNQLQSLNDMSYKSLSSLPFILNHPLVARLKENESTAELKVAELTERYGAKHPKMMAARSDLKAVGALLLTQMELITEGIENDYSAAKSKEKTLVAALDETKARMLSINRTEFELSDYVRNVRANRALYETFFKRINETAETSTLRTANARIVDTAVIPEEAFKPKKKLIVMLVLVVSLILGVTLAFLLDALDSTIKHADDVDYKLNASMLGLLPLLPASKDKMSKDKTAAGNAHVRAFMHGDHTGFKESVRTLRTSITLASLEKPVQTLLFTSSVPGEGKTTTSVNLACAYGQMEKVLLIDADMRRPTVAKQLRLPHGSRGLSNAVAYPEMLDDCIHAIEDLGIDVMPAGAIPPNPLELLSSKNFSDILETLKTRYTKIVIDSAPMQAVSDALYLSTLTDGIIYVVKADATREKLVKGGLSRLEDANARILGVVLNQVDVEKEARYGGTYGGYYDNYDYSNS
ncbi:MAG: succinoglycan biosynthesis transport protein ExoP [Paraglaciecola sp.]|jgi:succinoglycan biosynthesis transport protein ExoP